jgi:hypothetical protein
MLMEAGWVGEYHDHQEVLTGKPDANLRLMIDCPFEVVHQINAISLQIIGSPNTSQ